jgi:hypothetical protein
MPKWRKFLPFGMSRLEIFGRVTLLTEKKGGKKPPGSIRVIEKGYKTCGFMLAAWILWRIAPQNDGWTNR